MGISRTWTEEEKAYVQDKWGEISISSMSKKLNRSERSISNMRLQLKLGPFLDGGGYITFKQLLPILGLRSYTEGIKMLVKQKGLPIKEQQIIKRKYKVVYYKDFWQWAETNQEAINWSKVRVGILGKEPDWVKYRRKIDGQTGTIITKSRELWTKEDDVYLTQLLKLHKYTSLELSQILGRTENAIYTRIYRLGLREMPISDKTNVTWPEKDCRLLDEMIQQGYSYELISKRIGRSVTAIRSKVQRVYGGKVSLEKIRKEEKHD